MLMVSGMNFDTLVVFSNLSVREGILLHKTRSIFYRPKFERGEMVESSFLHYGFMSSMMWWTSLHHTRKSHLQTRGYTCVVVLFLSICSCCIGMILLNQFGKNCWWESFRWIYYILPHVVKIVWFVQIYLYL